MEDLILRFITAINSQSLADLSKDDLAKLPDVLGKAFGGGKIDSSTDQLRKVAQDNLQGLESIMSTYYATPEGKKVLAESMRKKAKGRMSEAASEGLDFLASFAEIATTMNSISETEKDLAGVAPPAVPGVPGATPSLKEAVGLARERAYDPYSSSEVNALLGSQAMDTLKGLQTAKQVSGGQASTFQANAQDVIDRARFGKIQAAGMLQEGTRQAEGQFLQASAAESRENMQRAGLQQNLYGLQSRNYMFDKGMADAALSAQRGNMMTALQNAEIRLPNAIGGGLSRLYNKPAYTGMGQSMDNQDAFAHQTLNRLRNQKMMFGQDFSSTGSLASTFSGQ